MFKLYIYKNKEDLNKILKKYKIKLKYTPLGKPYSDKYYLSFSHKDNINICLISDHNIGVDIEKITYKERVIKHSFLKEEYPKDEIEFTKVWTIKESYSKMIGTGISYGLKNIDTTKIKNKKTYLIKNYIIGVVYQWSKIL